MGHPDSDEIMKEFMALFDDGVVYSGKVVQESDVHHPIEPQDQEKPTLKVFKIIVWEHGADQRVQRDIIVMLARNPANAIKLCGYNGDEFEFVWEELEGPFKEGSILSSWADINE